MVRRMLSGGGGLSERRRSGKLEIFCLTPRLLCCPRRCGKEAVISIRGEKHWLWRAVDQDGFVLEVLVQSRRNGTVNLTKHGLKCGMLGHD